MLFALPFAVLLVIVLSACPVTALLKRKFVLFAAGLVLVGVGFPAFGLGEAVGASFLVLGAVAWVVGASLLASPVSRWARQLYGPQKSERARARRGDAAAQPAMQAAQAENAGAPPAASGDPTPAPASGAFPTPAAEHSPPPSQLPPVVLTGAVVAAAIGLAALGAASGDVLGAVTTGAMLPLLWLVRAGWRQGRSAVATLAVLLAAWWAYAAWSTSVGAGSWAFLAVGLVLLAAGLGVLFTRAVGAYLETADR